MEFKHRLKELLNAKDGGNMTPLARFCGVTPQAVQQWVSKGTTPRVHRITQIATYFGITEQDLIYGEAVAAMLYAAIPVANRVNLISSEPAEAIYETAGGISERLFEIPCRVAPNSCGGSSLPNEGKELGDTVLKELSFFQKYRLDPENAFAILADGNGMADYIIDGDTVIFDHSCTEPQSGKIFVIAHPDGLRIKQLRREIDGSWILENRNTDKHRYPDERLAPEQGALLKIHGRFVYRQGG
ncbi:LexA family transcriptional regulator [Herbaspirillum sp. RTI4]|uniref:LexA family transcriptional regulator n=1 Tax=Herbaspirillum sp. RTI4 TaxID=3048640 RepID=UPI002AB445F5|nr:LexA family transcriptional regulator [Herbaspirillum sp. RTI4]MDY7578160.1 LexA family transcriptional regulator [Herbaspirillum sp. RTI4]MEA9980749.1 LexA family transcriptional regulator [Herbaspirillum sp. RTI4]